MQNYSKTIMIRVGFKPHSLQIHFHKSTFLTSYYKVLRKSESLKLYMFKASMMYYTSCFIPAMPVLGLSRLINPDKCWTVCHEILYMDSRSPEDVSY